MKNRTRITVALSAFGVISLIWIAAAGAQGMFKGKPTVVAVVGIEGVWNGIQAMNQVKAEIEREKEEMLAEQQARQKKIKDRQDDIDWLPEGSPEQDKKMEEVEEMAAHLKGWMEFQQARLARSEKIRYERLYRETREAVKEVAEANNVDLVLFKEPGINLNRRLSTAQLLALIGNRKVLYVRDELDLTDQVITRMNNKAKVKP